MGTLRSQARCSNHSEAVKPVQGEGILEGSIELLLQCSHCTSIHNSSTKCSNIHKEPVGEQVLNSLSSIGVAAAEGAADGSTPDSAQDKAENREATESALADDSTRLATLEREVSFQFADS